MTSHADELLRAAEAFTARYHANTKLCAEQADWDCSVCLWATDAQHGLTLEIVRGRVQRITAPQNPAGASSAQLTVNATQQILLDILQLRLNPNQPYLFGELTVLGAESDFMRVDYLATMLCAL